MGSVLIPVRVPRLHPCHFRISQHLAQAHKLTDTKKAGAVKRKSREATPKIKHLGSKKAAAIPKKEEVARKQLTVKVTAPTPRKHKQEETPDEEDSDHTDQHLISDGNRDEVISFTGEPKVTL